MNTARQGVTSETTERFRRARERSRRIRAHMASSWADADRWDLDFWQSQSPQARLSALVSLRKDLESVHGDLANLDWSD